MGPHSGHKEARLHLAWCLKWLLLVSTATLCVAGVLETLAWTRREAAPKVVRFPDRITLPTETILGYRGSTLWNGLHDIEYMDGFIFMLFEYGIHVVDTSQVSTPETICRILVPYPQSVDYSNGLLGIVHRSNGLTLVDMVVPTDPRVIGQVDLPDTPNDLVMVGSYAYVAASHEGLLVVDISEPQNAKVVRRFDTPGFATGIAYQSGHLYLGDGATGLLILDISDPTSPTTIATVATTGLAYRPLVEGARVYLATSDGQFPGERGLAIIAIDTISSPRLVSETSGAVHPRKVIKFGSTVCLMDFVRGFGVLDITDERHPILTSDVPHGYCGTSDTEHLITAENWFGLETWDVSLPGSPVVVRHMELATDSRTVAVQDSLVFTATGLGDFYVVNAADLRNMVRIGSFRRLSESPYLNMTVAVSRAFVTDALGMISVVNISDPTSPYVSGHMMGTVSPVGIAIQWPLAYVADGVRGLMVFEILDPDQPRLLSTRGGGGGGIAIHGMIAYSAGSEPELALINVSNSASPVEISRFYFARGSGKYGVGDMVLDQQKVYMAMGSEGIGIVDVSDSLAPRLLGQYKQFDMRISSISLFGRVLYGVDYGRAVVAFDVSDPTKPVPIAEFATPGWTRDVVASHKGVFVVDELGLIALTTFRAQIGNVNSDRAINTADIIYLVDYLYRGGPQPIPELEFGDTNCDGYVTLEDVVVLANYVLKGCEAITCR